MSLPAFPALPRPPSAPSVHAGRPDLRVAREGERGKGFSFTVQGERRRIRCWVRVGGRRPDPQVAPGGERGKGAADGGGGLVARRADWRSLVCLLDSRQSILMECRHLAQHEISVFGCCPSGV